MTLWNCTDKNKKNREAEKSPKQAGLEGDTNSIETAESITSKQDVWNLTEHTDIRRKTKANILEFI